MGRKRFFLHNFFAVLISFSFLVENVSWAYSYDLDFLKELNAVYKLYSPVRQAFVRVIGRQPSTVEVHRFAVQARSLGGVSKIYPVLLKYRGLLYGAGQLWQGLTSCGDEVLQVLLSQEGCSINPALYTMAADLLLLKGKEDIFDTESKDSKVRYVSLYSLILVSAWKGISLVPLEVKDLSYVPKGSILLLDSRSFGHFVYLFDIDEEKRECILWDEGRFRKVLFSSLSKEFTGIVLVRQNVLFSIPKDSYRILSFEESRHIWGGRRLRTGGSQDIDIDDLIPTPSLADVAISVGLTIVSAAIAGGGSFSGFISSYAAAEVGNAVSSGLIYSGVDPTIAQITGSVVSSAALSGLNVKMNPSLVSRSFGPLGPRVANWVGDSIWRGALVGAMKGAIQSSLAVGISKALKPMLNDHPNLRSTIAGGLSSIGTTMLLSGVGHMLNTPSYMHGELDNGVAQSLIDPKTGACVEPPSVNSLPFSEVTRNNEFYHLSNQLGLSNSKVEIVYSLSSESTGDFLKPLGGNNFALVDPTGKVLDILSRQNGIFRSYYVGGFTDGVKDAFRANWKPWLKWGVSTGLEAGLVASGVLKETSFLTNVISSAPGMLFDMAYANGGKSGFENWKKVIWGGIRSGITSFAISKLNKFFEKRGLSPYTAPVCSMFAMGLLEAGVIKAFGQADTFSGRPTWGMALDYVKGHLRGIVDMWNAPQPLNYSHPAQYGYSESLYFNRIWNAAGISGMVERKDYLVAQGVSDWRSHILPSSGVILPTMVSQGAQSVAGKIFNELTFDIVTDTFLLHKHGGIYVTYEKDFVRKLQDIGVHTSYNPNSPGGILGWVRENVLHYQPALLGFTTPGNELWHKGITERLNEPVKMTGDWSKKVNEQISRADSSYYFYQVYPGADGKYVLAVTYFKDINIPLFNKIVSSEFGTIAKSRWTKEGANPLDPKCEIYELNFSPVGIHRFGLKVPSIAIRVRGTPGFLNERVSVRSLMNQGLKNNRLDSLMPQIEKVFSKAKIEGRENGISIGKFNRISLDDIGARYWWAGAEYRFAPRFSLMVNDNYSYRIDDNLWSNKMGLEFFKNTMDEYHLFPKITRTVVMHLTIRNNEGGKVFDLGFNGTRVFSSGFSHHLKPFYRKGEGYEIKANRVLLELPSVGKNVYGISTEERLDVTVLDGHFKLFGNYSIPVPEKRSPSPNKVSKIYVVKVTNGNGTVKGTPGERMREVYKIKRALSSDFKTVFGFPVNYDVDTKAFLRDLYSDKIAPGNFDGYIQVSPAPISNAIIQTGRIGLTGKDLTRIGINNIAGLKKIYNDNPSRKWGSFAFLSGKLVGGIGGLLYSIKEFGEVNVGDKKAVVRFNRGVLGNFHLDVMKVKNRHIFSIAIRELNGGRPVDGSIVGKGGNQIAAGSFTVKNGRFTLDLKRGGIEFGIPVGSKEVEISGGKTTSSTLPMPDRIAPVVSVVSKVERISPNDSNNDGEKKNSPFETKLTARQIGFNKTTGENRIRVIKGELPLNTVYRFGGFKGDVGGFYGHLVDINSVLRGGIEVQVPKDVEWGLLELIPSRKVVGGEEPIEIPYDNNGHIVKLPNKKRVLAPTYVSLVNPKTSFSVGVKADGKNRLLFNYDNVLKNSGGFQKIFSKNPQEKGVAFCLMSGAFNQQLIMTPVSPEGSLIFEVGENGQAVFKGEGFEIFTPSTYGGMFRLTEEGDYQGVGPTMFLGFVDPSVMRESSGKKVNDKIGDPKRNLQGQKERNLHIGVAGDGRLWVIGNNNGKKISHQEPKLKQWQSEETLNNLSLVVTSERIQDIPQRIHSPTISGLFSYSGVSYAYPETYITVTSPSGRQIPITGDGRNAIVSLVYRNTSGQNKVSTVTIDLANGEIPTESKDWYVFYNNARRQFIGETPRELPVGQSNVKELNKLEKEDIAKKVELCVIINGLFPLTPVYNIALKNAPVFLERLSQTNDSASEKKSSHPLDSNGRPQVGQLANRIYKKDGYYYAQTSYIKFSPALGIVSFNIPVFGNMQMMLESGLYIKGKKRILLPLAYQFSDNGALTRLYAVNPMLTVKPDGDRSSIVEDNFPNPEDWYYVQYRNSGSAVGWPLSGLVEADRNDTTDRDNSWWGKVKKLVSNFWKRPNQEVETSSEDLFSSNSPMVSFHTFGGFRIAIQSMVKGEVVSRSTLIDNVISRYWVEKDNSSKGKYIINASLYQYGKKGSKPISIEQTELYTKISKINTKLSHREEVPDHLVGWYKWLAGSFAEFLNNSDKLSSAVKWERYAPDFSYLLNVLSTAKKDPLAISDIYGYIRYLSTKGHLPNKYDEIMESWPLRNEGFQLAAILYLREELSKYSKDELQGMVSHLNMLTPVKKKTYPPAYGAMVTSIVSGTPYSRWQLFWGNFSPAEKSVGVVVGSMFVGMFGLGEGIMTTAISHTLSAAIPAAITYVDLKGKNVPTRFAIGSAIVSFTAAFLLNKFLPGCSFSNKWVNYVVNFGRGATASMGSMTFGVALGSAADGKLQLPDSSSYVTAAVLGGLGGPKSFGRGSFTAATNNIVKSSIGSSGGFVTSGFVRDALQLTRYVTSYYLPFDMMIGGPISNALIGPGGITHRIENWIVRSLCGENPNKNSWRYTLALAGTSALRTYLDVLMIGSLARFARVNPIAKAMFTFAEMRMVYGFYTHTAETLQEINWGEVVSPTGNWEDRNKFFGGFVGTVFGMAGVGATFKGIEAARKAGKEGRGWGRSILTGAKEGLKEVPWGIAKETVVLGGIGGLYRLNPWVGKAFAGGLIGLRTALSNVVEFRMKDEVDLRTANDINSRGRNFARKMVNPVFDRLYKKADRKYSLRIFSRETEKGGASEGKTEAEVDTGKDNLGEGPSEVKPGRIRRFGGKLVRGAIRGAAHLVGLPTEFESMYKGNVSKLAEYMGGEKDVQELKKQLTEAEVINENNQVSEDAFEELWQRGKVTVELQKNGETIKKEFTDVEVDFVRGEIARDAARRIEVYRNALRRLERRGNNEGIEKIAERISEEAKRIGIEHIHPAKMAYDAVIGIGREKIREEISRIRENNGEQETKAEEIVADKLLGAMQKLVGITGRGLLDDLGLSIEMGENGKFKLARNLPIDSPFIRAINSQVEVLNLMKEFKGNAESLKEIGEAYSEVLKAVKDANIPDLIERWKEELKSKLESKMQNERVEEIAKETAKRVAEKKAEKIAEKIAEERGNALQKRLNVAFLEEVINGNGKFAEKVNELEKYLEGKEKANLSEALKAVNTKMEDLREKIKSLKDKETVEQFKRFIEGAKEVYSGLSDNFSFREVQNAWYVVGNAIYSGANAAVGVGKTLAIHLTNLSWLKSGEKYAMHVVDNGTLSLQAIKDLMWLPDKALKDVEIVHVGDGTEIKNRIGELEKLKEKGEITEKEEKELALLKKVERIDASKFAEEIKKGIKDVKGDEAGNKPNEGKTIYIVEWQKLGMELARLRENGDYASVLQGLAKIPKVIDEDTALGLIGRYSFIIGGGGGLKVDFMQSDVGEAVGIIKDVYEEWKGNENKSFEEFLKEVLTAQGEVRGDVEIGDKKLSDIFEEEIRNRAGKDEMKKGRLRLLVRKSLNTFADLMEIGQVEAHRDLFGRTNFVVEERNGKEIIRLGVVQNRKVERSMRSGDPHQVAADVHIIADILEGNDVMQELLGEKGNNIKERLSNELERLNGDGNKNLNLNDIAQQIRKHTEASGGCKSRVEVLEMLVPLLSRGFMFSGTLSESYRRMLHRMTGQLAEDYIEALKLPEHEGYVRLPGGGKSRICYWVGKDVANLGEDIAERTLGLLKEKEKDVVIIATSDVMRMEEEIKGKVEQENGTEVEVEILDPSQVNERMERLREENEKRENDEPEKKLIIITDYNKAYRGVTFKNEILGSEKVAMIADVRELDLIKASQLIGRLSRGDIPVEGEIHIVVSNELYDRRYELAESVGEYNGSKSRNKDPFEGMNEHMIVRKMIELAGMRQARMTEMNFLEQYEKTMGVDFPLMAMERAILLQHGRNSSEYRSFKRAYTNILNDADLQLRELRAAREGFSGAKEELFGPEELARRCMANVSRIQDKVITEVEKAKMKGKHIKWLKEMMNYDEVRRKALGKKKEIDMKLQESEETKEAKKTQTTAKSQPNEQKNTTQLMETKDSSGRGESKIKGQKSQVQKTEVDRPKEDANNNFISGSLKISTSGNEQSLYRVEEAFDNLVNGLSKEMKPEEVAKILSKLPRAGLALRSPPNVVNSVKGLLNQLADALKIKATDNVSNNVSNLISQMKTYRQELFSLHQQLQQLQPQFQEVSQSKNLNSVVSNTIEGSSLSLPLQHSQAQPGNNVRVDSQTSESFSPIDLSVSSSSSQNGLSDTSAYGNISSVQIGNIFSKNDFSKLLSCQLKLQIINKRINKLVNKITADILESGGNNAAGQNDVLPNREEIEEDLRRIEKEIAELQRFSKEVIFDIGQKLDVAAGRMEQAGANAQMDSQINGLNEKIEEMRDNFQRLSDDLQNCLKSIGTKISPIVESYNEIKRAKMNKLGQKLQENISLQRKGEILMWLSGEIGKLTDNLSEGKLSGEDVIKLVGRIDGFIRKAREIGDREFVRTLEDLKVVVTGILINPYVKSDQAVAMAVIDTELRKGISDENQHIAIDNMWVEFFNGGLSIGEVVNRLKMWTGKGIKGKFGRFFARRMGTIQLFAEKEFGRIRAQWSSPGISGKFKAIGKAVTLLPYVLRRAPKPVLNSIDGKRVAMVSEKTWNALDRKLKGTMLPSSLMNRTDVLQGASKTSIISSLEKSFGMRFRDKIKRSLRIPIMNEPLYVPDSSGNLKLNLSTKESKIKFTLGLGLSALILSSVVTGGVAAISGISAAVGIKSVATISAIKGLWSASSGLMVVKSVMASGASEVWLPEAMARINNITIGQKDNENNQQKDTTPAIKVIPEPQKLLENYARKTMVDKSFALKKASQTTLSEIDSLGASSLSWVVYSGGEVGSSIRPFTRVTQDLDALLKQMKIESDVVRELICRVAPPELVRKLFDSKSKPAERFSAMEKILAMTMAALRTGELNGLQDEGKIEQAIERIKREMGSKHGQSNKQGQDEDKINEIKNKIKERIQNDIETLSRWHRVMHDATHTLNPLGWAVKFMDKFVNGLETEWVWKEFTSAYKREFGDLSYINKLKFASKTSPQQNESVSGKNLQTGDNSSAVSSKETINSSLPKVDSVVERFFEGVKDVDNLLEEEIKKHAREINNEIVSSYETEGKKRIFRIKMGLKRKVQKAMSIERRLFSTPMAVVWAMSSLGITSAVSLMVWVPILGVSMISAIKNQFKNREEEKDKDVIRTTIVSAVKVPVLWSAVFALAGVGVAVKGLFMGQVAGAVSALASPVVGWMAGLGVVALALLGMVYLGRNKIKKMIDRIFPTAREKGSAPTSGAKGKVIQMKPKMQSQGDQQENKGNSDKKRWLVAAGIGIAALLLLSSLSSAMEFAPNTVESKGISFDLLSTLMSALPMIGFASLGYKVSRWLFKKMRRKGRKVSEVKTVSKKEDKKERIDQMIESGEAQDDMGVWMRIRAKLMGLFRGTQMQVIALGERMSPVGLKIMFGESWITSGIRMNIKVKLINSLWWLKMQWYKRALELSAKIKGEERISIELVFVSNREDVQVLRKGRDIVVVGDFSAGSLSEARRKLGIFLEGEKRMRIKEYVRNLPVFVRGGEFIGENIWMPAVTREALNDVIEFAMRRWPVDEIEPILKGMIVEVASSFENDDVVRLNDGKIILSKKLFENRIGRKYLLKAALYYSLLSMLDPQRTDEVKMFAVFDFLDYSLMKDRYLKRIDNIGLTGVINVIMNFDVRNVFGMAKEKFYLLYKEWIEDRFLFGFYRRWKRLELIVWDRFLEAARRWNGWYYKRRKGSNLVSLLPFESAR